MVKRRSTNISKFSNNDVTHTVEGISGGFHRLGEGRKAGEDGGEEGRINGKGKPCLIKGFSVSSRQDGMDKMNNGQVTPDGSYI